MQQLNENQNNVVTVIGRVVSDFTFSHEVYGEGFYKFNIEVPRLSEVTDILPATISERLIEKEKLLIGTLVEISGQLRSYNNYMEKKNRLVLTVFAREVNILDEIGVKNPNQVSLNGYVCKPPIYRSTPFGREIVDLLLAVNRSYNKSDYIPCIAWGRNAKFGGKFNIGDNIRVIGRMQSRPYQKKLEDGDVIERIALEVSISKIEYINSPAEDEPTE